MAKFNLKGKSLSCAICIESCFIKLNLTITGQIVGQSSLNCDRLEKLLLELEIKLSVDHFKTCLFTLDPSESTTILRSGILLLKLKYSLDRDKSLKQLISEQTNLRILQFVQNLLKSKINEPETSIIIYYFSSRSSVSVIVCDTWFQLWILIF